MADKEKKTNKERIAEGQMLLRVILEIAGSPKDHVEKAISMLVDRLESAKYVSELVSEEVFEAEEHEEHKNVFTALAELDLWVKKSDNLVDISFDFMPASIEVIEPENPVVDNKLMTSLMNELLAKLHKSDMIVKNVSAKQQTLERNSNVVMRNFVVYCLKENPKTLSEISKSMGVSGEHMEKFLGLLVKGGELVKENDVYSIASKNVKK